MSDINHINPDDTIKPLAEDNDPLGREIGDALGLQRMDQPHQRHGQPQSLRGIPKPSAKRGDLQRPPHDAGERQRRQHVNQEIDRMVTPHLQAADGVVEREGKGDEWPPL